MNPFHKHKWAIWYFEEKLDHTVRNCLKCGKQEKAIPSVDYIYRPKPPKPPRGLDAPLERFNPLQEFRDGILPHNGETIIRIQDWLERNRHLR